jgi:hypothetical protein
MTSAQLSVMWLTAASGLAASVLFDSTLRGSLRAQGGAGGRGAAPQQISSEAIPRESPFASRLSSVSDITVETVVGALPRLPAHVAAVYRDGGRGRVFAGSGPPLTTTARGPARERRWARPSWSAGAPFRTLSRRARMEDVTVVVAGSLWWRQGRIIL